VRRFDLYFRASRCTPSINTHLNDNKRVFAGFSRWHAISSHALRELQKHVSSLIERDVVSEDVGDRKRRVRKHGSRCICKSPDKSIAAPESAALVRGFEDKAPARLRKGRRHALGENTRPDQHTVASPRTSTASFKSEPRCAHCL
jgi:hypothetical protein